MSRNSHHEELTINKKERDVPQVLMPPSKAVVEWSGWPEIWKKRYELALDGAGSEAFVAYLKTKISGPWKYHPNHARRLAAMLRGGPRAEGVKPLEYPYAFPHADIKTVIGSIIGPKGTTRPADIHTLGRWAREGGGHVYYTIPQLNGIRLAPGTTDNKTLLQISAALSAAQRAVSKVDVTQDDVSTFLDQSMREQLTAVLEDVGGDLNRIRELLRAGV